MANVRIRDCGSGARSCSNVVSRCRVARRARIVREDGRSRFRVKHVPQRRIVQIRWSWEAMRRRMAYMSGGRCTMCCWASADGGLGTKLRAQASRTHWRGGGRIWRVARRITRRRRGCRTANDAWLKRRGRVRLRRASSAPARNCCDCCRCIARRGRSDGWRDVSA